MDRTTLAPHTGMLFAFDTSGRHDFWMKSTLIDLDMVYLDDNLRVSRIWRDVPRTAPGTTSDHIARRSGTGRYVIELNANEAHADDIIVGTRLDMQSVPNCSVPFSPQKSPVSAKSDMNVPTLVPRPAAALPVA